MDASTKQRLLLVLLVPVSSVTGLARAMAEAGVGTFGDVWVANLWGDLFFTFGTMAVGCVVFHWLARSPPDRRNQALALAVPASFLLHWLVYAASWTLTGPTLFSDEGAAFLSVSADGFLHAWRFTLEWGWFGLLAMAATTPAIARALLPKPAPSVAAGPVLTNPEG